MTDDDLLTGQNQMLSDPAFRGESARLIDATACERLDVSSETVRFVARSAEHRGMRRAALAASTDTVYGLMRMYEGYAWQAECAVFRELATAVQRLYGRPA